MGKDTKIRWGRGAKLIDIEKGDVMVEDEQVLTDDQILRENAHREIYDPKEKTIDFRKTMPTQVKNNPRVMNGISRPPKEEALLTTRNVLIEHTVLEYLSQNANTENMTKSEGAGLKKLGKR